MTAKASLKGRWALITGASSGFGRDYAELLAAKGVNLVLTARRVDRLEALAATITREHGVKVEIVPSDLAVADAPRTLYETIAQMGIVIDVLINNAGYGLYGDFAETDWDKTHAMLQVDIIALTHLTKLYVDAMKQRNFGYVLLVASIGAYQPSPTYAAYSAAKSYVLNFGEALNFELRGSGVNVSVLSPGVTATEFLAVAGQKATLYQRLVMMPSRPVAATGLGAMLRGVPSRVPGLINYLTVVSTKILPRRWQARIAYQLMRAGS